MLSFEEFVDWYKKQVAADRWSIWLALECADIIDEVQKAPLWKRNATWSRRAKRARELVRIVEDRYYSL